MEALAERRLEVVRRHMASENAHDFDTTIDTFAHPRYELIPTGQVFDGEDEVRAYFAGSRAAFADQRNEPIALHATDAGVFAEFWLLGTTPDPCSTTRRPAGRSGCGWWRSSSSPRPTAPGPTASCASACTTTSTRSSPSSG